MNEPNSRLNEVEDYASEYGSELDQSVRRNPGTSLLIAVGVGLVIAAIVRALRPEPKPQHRLMELLEDVEDRLRDLGSSAQRKGGKLASEGASKLSDGVHRGEAQLDRLVRQASRRLRGMCS